VVGVVVIVVVINALDIGFEAQRLETLAEEAKAMLVVATWRVLRIDGDESGGQLGHLVAPRGDGFSQLFDHSKHPTLARHNRHDVT